MNRLAFLTLAIATALVLGCGGTAAPAADQEGLKNSPYCLSLGDSIPFGYNSCFLPPPNDNVFDATAYPWYLAQMIDLPVVNPSCEGQTSDGFIRSDGTDRGCFWFRDTYPQGMHVAYPGSQLEFAAGYLAAHSRPRLVTLMIGSNDVQLLADACAWDPACVAPGLPPVLRNLARNLATIVGTLRAVSPETPIILQNYYDPYAPPTPFEPIVQALNGTIEAVAAAFGIPVSDVYGAFRTASAPFDGDPCKAGLLQVHPDGSCGEHPSPAGARLIAETIAPLVPPWTGKP
jgi:lysophospholipase L1-like esterase